MIFLLSHVLKNNISGLGVSKMIATRDGLAGRGLRNAVAGLLRLFHVPSWNWPYTAWFFGHGPLTVPWSPIRMIPFFNRKSMGDSTKSPILYPKRFIGCVVSSSVICLWCASSCSRVLYWFRLPKSPAWCCLDMSFILWNTAYTTYASECYSSTPVHHVCSYVWCFFCVNLRGSLQSIDGNATDRERNANT